jgi:hypothetical protein
MTEEVKPIKPVTLNMPKPELKELDKTPLTKCELCLHFRSYTGFVIDGKRLIDCGYYNEHIEPRDSCKHFAPAGKDPVIAYINRELIDMDTAETSGLWSITDAMELIKHELTENKICKEVSTIVEICGENYETCRILVNCDKKEYKIAIAVRSRAIIEYVERGEK